MVRQPNIGTDLKAVRDGIATHLRKLHSDVVHQPITEGMAELLKLLEQSESGERDHQTQ